MFEFNLHRFSHRMSRGEAVRFVIAENSAIIDPDAMGQEECQVVAHHLSPFIDPDFFAKKSDTASTFEGGFIVGVFAKA